MSIGVYSVDNGYDDWVKYTASYWNNNSWGIILDTAAHKFNGGQYNVYVYAADSLGNTGMVKYGSFNVPYSNSSVDGFYSTDYGSVFELGAAGVTSYYGAKEVYFYVCTNDTNGRWYYPEYYSTYDEWSTYVSRSFFGDSNENSYYYVDVYIKDNRDCDEYIRGFYGQP